jgi:predicted alpha-1,2-mannosidase
VDGMMQSLLEMYREGGWLPKWPNPSYTGIMSGAPAEIVLEEAMKKGFVGFDHALAKAAIAKNRSVPQQLDEKRRWYDREEYAGIPETRAGLTSYLARGYVASDITAESVSRTLDFAFADRNRNYTNLWNAAAKRFLPRRSDGSWDGRARGAYTECSVDTALWCVPHDVENLVSLLGGPAAFEAELDRYFDELFFKANQQGSSLHGNEPTHHTAYLYNRIGRPEKTQRRVRDILRRSYSSSRRGFDGNEDCGQMSAWYILSALGFYPADPVSGEYELGSPLVESAELHLGAPYSGTTLRIKAVGYSPGRWRVGHAAFNGSRLESWRISHADLVRGGVLEFHMTD